MNPFTYTRAGDARQAINAFQGSPASIYVAGATDVLQLLQEDVSAPGMLIDISRLPHTQIDAGPGGACIGALARLTDVAEDENVLRYYPMLAQALKETASPGCLFDQFLCPVVIAQLVRLQRILHNRPGVPTPAGRVLAVSHGRCLISVSPSAPDTADCWANARPAIRVAGWREHISRDRADALFSGHRIQHLNNVT
jgi:hypothetical protein